MKCIAVFLVLSMVLLMAEPGECFWGWVAGHVIKGIMNGGVENQNQLDKRTVEYIADDSQPPPPFPPRPRYH